VDTYVQETPEPDFKRIASDFEDKLLLQAQQKLEAFKKKHLKDIRIANAVVVTGTRYRQIIDYAKSENIDLIVMGSGKRGPRMMFGSVTDKVSRLAKVPVMLIKIR
jgi:nucleotide-binding universal stress UspA family protein